MLGSCGWHIRTHAFKSPGDKHNIAQMQVVDVLQSDLVYIITKQVYYYHIYSYTLVILVC